jgi:DNA modification methylase
MKNKLLNGDCLELMKSIPDKSIDMVLTDPPYLHIKGGNKGWVGKSYLFQNKQRFNDSYINTDMSDFGKLQIYEFLDIVKIKQKKMNAIIFCSELQLQYYFNWILINKYKYNLLVWDKGTKTIMNRNRYISNLEYIIRIYESKSKFNSISINEYYTKNKQIKADTNKLHNTQKPLELINQFIELHSNENDLILDCFAGSGTTAIACLNTNRNYICMEKDKTYFDIMTKRVEDHKKTLKLF